MIEFGEIVIFSVNDDRRIPNRTGVKAVWWSTTNGLSETKGDKTDSSHEDSNDGDESHLLAPCPLLFGRLET